MYSRWDILSALANFSVEFHSDIYIPYCGRAYRTSTKISLVKG